MLSSAFGIEVSDMLSRLDVKFAREAHPIDEGDDQWVSLSPSVSTRSRAAACRRQYSNHRHLTAPAGRR